jgi:hypothetical protein
MIWIKRAIGHLSNLRRRQAPRLPDSCSTAKLETL